MPEATPSLSRAELLAYAAERGCSTTVYQLERWRKRGLVPAPHIERKGRGRGTVSHYPFATGDQLVAIHRVLLTQRRSVKAAAWELWIDGYDVPISRIRPFLREAIQLFEDMAARVHVRWDADDKHETAWSRMIATKRLTNPWLGQIRRRVGREAFPTVLMLIAELFSGSSQGFDQANLDLLLRAVMRGPQAARKAGREFASLAPFVLPPLNELARLLRETPARTVLEETDDAELQIARDEVCALRKSLGTVMRWVEELTGIAPAGSADQLEAGQCASLPPQAFVVWLVARRHPFVRSHFPTARAMLEAPLENWPRPDARRSGTL